MSSSAQHDELFSFLQDCEKQLVATATTDIAKDCARAFGRALANASALDYTPSTVPVVQNIHEAVDTDLSRRCAELTDSLAWVPSFRMTDGGTTTALMSFEKIFDLGTLRCGLLYLGEGNSYPEHQHEPQELYMILSGEASWLHGGNEQYENVTPNSIIYNKPHDLHGVRAGDSPLLAMYLLWQSD